MPITADDLEDTLPAIRARLQGTSCAYRAKIAGDAGLSFDRLLQILSQKRGPANPTLRTLCNLLRAMERLDHEEAAHV
jgi:DNA-binding phage protein